MPSVVVIGAQWGDEGKGKIIDFYAERADLVVRFNGGSNAGHTVVVNGKEHKFHLMPSGAVRGKKVVIANGVVVDPKLLWEKEIPEITLEGVKLDLLISDRAHVVLPFHRQLDGLEEKFKGKWKAGTTGRGIGPCYSDKAARIGIRMGELVEPSVFREKLASLYDIKKRLLQAYGEAPAQSEESILKEYSELGKNLKPFVGDSATAVCEALDSKKKVLFEGAQGAMLDIDHGLYPFGTSSNTISGGACTGAGVPPTRIGEIIGVAKAYLSRVGEGPVPTELKDETGDWIRKQGAEFGTTTGRPRRCGWIDMVTLRYSCAINGFTGLAITKLDVLGGLDEVKICVAYDVKGRRTTSQPVLSRDYEQCTPVYEKFKGWKQLSEEQWLALTRKGYAALPIKMRDYVKTLSRMSNTPISLVSVGRDRNATIELKNPFASKK